MKDPVSNSSSPNPSVSISTTSKASAVVPLVRLVDDDETYLQSTTFLLRMSGFEVLAYSSSKSFLELDDPQRPGCVVLDLCMPGMNGSELHEALVEKGAHLPVIFLSGHGDVPTAMRAVKRGAVDFLVKPADPRELIEAVRGAVERSLEAHVARQADVEARELVARLTAKEAAVAALVAEGLLNKQIADRLGVTVATVKMHRGNLTRKLECRSAVAVRDVLVRAGVLEADAARPR